MITPYERVAWAAGIFEGEGNIFLRRNEGSISVVLQMSMTDEDVIRRFHESIFGLGNVTGPWYNKKKTVTGKDFKPKWHWRTIKTDTVITVYSMFRPWLCERRTTYGDSALRTRYKYEQYSPNVRTFHEFPDWITDPPVLGKQ